MLANRVREARVGRGLTQAQLAQQLGLNPSVLSRIEGGAWTPNTAVALALGRCLGRSVEWLFDPGPEPDCRHLGAEQCLVQLAEVAGQVQALPVGAGPELVPVFSPGDWVVDDPTPFDRVRARSTCLLLGCDPALGILAGLASGPDQRVLFRHATSAEALGALQARRCHVAGVHLAAADASPAELAELLRPQLGQGLRLITFATWEQGLMLAPGNPLGLRRAEDLLQPAVRLRTRALGSGCGLAFEPWIEVRCDLVLPAEADTSHPGLQALLNVLGSTELRRQLDALPGYSSRHSGTVLDLAPPAAEAAP